MKFRQRDPWSGKVSGAVDAEAAVTIAVEHGAAGCDGQLERMQGKLDALTAIVGRLLASRDMRERATLAEVMGYGWEVAEEE